MPGTIFAMHAAQHSITARLQGHVRMLGDAPRGSDQFDQFVGPVHRLDARDAEFFELRFQEYRAEQVLEVRLPAFASIQIASPAAEVDAADHHFAVACGHQRVHFANHLSQRQRPAVAADARDHAEGAAIVASVLHLEVGASAAGLVIRRLMIADRKPGRPGVQCGRRCRKPRSSSRISRSRFPVRVEMRKKRIGVLPRIGWWEDLRNTISAS